MSGRRRRRPSFPWWAVSAVAVAACTPATTPAPADAPMQWTETATTQCPDGMLARDYEGAVFEVGVDRVRPEWGTYVPWLCLGIEPAGLDS